MRIQQNPITQSNQPYLLAFLLLLLLSSVTALPTRAIVKRTGSPANPPDSDSVLAEKLKTPPDQSLFWRGYANGRPQGQSSAEYAQRNGLQTLSMTANANRVNAGTQNPPYEWWNKASKQFAKGASGRVQVLAGTMGKQPGTRLEDSIWHKTELPALTKPGKALPVKEIISINPETNAKERTWKAGNPPQGAGSAGPPRPPTPLSPGGNTALPKPRPAAANSRIPAPTTKTGQSQPKPAIPPPKPRPAAPGSKIPAYKNPAAPKPRPAAPRTRIPAPKNTTPAPKNPAAKLPTTPKPATRSKTLVPKKSTPLPARRRKSI